MRVPCLAAILLLSAAAPLGYAQTQAPTPHQGTGNQRGAGLSPENSSNGGAGTTSGATKSKHAKSRKKSTTPQNGTGSTTAPGMNTNPGETPANGKASNGSTPPQM